MTNRVSLLLAFAILVGSAASAEARPGRFLGSHPIAAKFGGGYCYIEAPHIHAYTPDKPALYQQVGDSTVYEHVRSIEAREGAEVSFEELYEQRGDPGAPEDEEAGA